MLNSIYTDKKFCNYIEVHMKGKRTLPPALKLAADIRKKCIQCTCGQLNEIKCCPVTECALYPHRFGANAKTRKANSSYVVHPSKSE